MSNAVGIDSRIRAGRAERWVFAAMGHPGRVLALALLCVAVAGLGLRDVRKDPSVDAFVPADHPAALARDEARELFGVEDPVVVGLVAPPGRSAFTPPVLEALRRIHDRVRLLPEVRKHEVVSLASERVIHGDGGDLLVDPILEDGPLSAADAALARERVQAMPMFLGLLASRSGDTVTLIVPVEDPNHAQEVYRAIRAVAEAEAPPEVSVQVAGVAAMNARLAAIVDGDTRLFIPLAVLVVLGVLLVALRRPVALLGPLLVIAGSAAVAIGLMGWTGSRYYLITTALPVVVMAIAVADCLHVTAFHLQARSEEPGFSARDAVAIAVGRTWLPVTLTSLTTIAAFLGLSVGAAMRPISEFGVFAAAGVAGAWLLSLTALPAVLVLTDLAPGSGPARPAAPAAVDRVLGRFTAAVAGRPLVSLAVLGLCVAGLVLAATGARFDYERKRYFAPDDPVRTADGVLSERLGGLNFLDVIVEAPEEGGMLRAETIAALGELRRELASLPGVTRVSAIDDYVQVMHRALVGEEAERIPLSGNRPAQYLFLYEAAGEPEDFRHEIDYVQRHARVRAQLDTDRYQAVRPIVDRVEALVARWAEAHGLAAVPTGRLAVNDGWMTQLASTHFQGLGLAALLVFAATVAAFRALRPALLAMVPVVIGVLTVYAAMGLFAVDIAPATSMTAAIATGLGVDFGIHLIAHLRRKLAEGQTLAAALAGHYLVVVRACFFSAVALGTALAVICASSAPPLRWFGLLVSAGAFGSLFGALCVLPALLALLRRDRPASGPLPRAALPLLPLALAVLALAPGDARADAAGDALARRVHERPANEGRVGVMHFRLVNRSGKVRERVALMAHAERGAITRVAIFFTSPAVIRDTAFLSYDRREGEDEHWLYLPATERVRRLPSSERGDAFMGTDLTYGDIKDDFRFGLEDWRFEHGGTAPSGLEVLRGRAVSPQVARELGYSAFEAQVDPETLFPRHVRFDDVDGDLLKEVEVHKVEPVGGAWTALAFTVHQRQREHRTEVRFEDMRHVPELAPVVFAPDRLALGVPRIP